MIFADMIPIALKLQKWQIAIFSVVRPIRVATLQPLILILWIIFILNGKWIIFTILTNGKAVNLVHSS